ncbi:MAG: DinB family protein, partial [Saprospiraceae bacterium]
MTQNELIDLLEADLRRLLDQVRTQIAPLDLDLLHYRPDPSQWNVLECFAHLNAFAEMYQPRIEAGIHKAKARKWIMPATEIDYTA